MRNNDKVEQQHQRLQQFCESLWDDGNRYGPFYALEVTQSLGIPPLPWALEKFREAFNAYIRCEVASIDEFFRLPKHKHLKSRGLKIKWGPTVWETVNRLRAEGEAVSDSLWDEAKEDISERFAEFKMSASWIRDVYRERETFERHTEFIEDQMAKEDRQFFRQREKS